MSPVPVLSVIETLDRGGAERLLVTQLRHLSRGRFSPRVASLFGPNPLATELRRMGVPVHELGLAGPGALPWGVHALRRLIRAQGIRIVHTHLFWANVAGRLATPPGVKIVSTLHNPDYSHEDDGTVRFRLRKALDRWTGRGRVDAFVAVSEEVRRDYERHMGFRDIRVIHNCADLDELRGRLGAVDRAKARTALGHAPGTVVVLHVGRHHPQKGLDLLLPALARARRGCSALALELVGDGPQRSALESMARALGIADCVRFRGMVSDVAPLLVASDAFVFPSRYEAFGIALLEAMAAGLPAVVSDAGGILELTSAESALVVPVGDERELSGALVKLGEDAALRRSLGQAAVVRAELFGVHRQLPMLEALYAAL